MDSPPFTTNQTQQLTVHIGNLSCKTTSHELEVLFSKVALAPVSKITLRLKEDNASAYAFAVFSSLEDCDKIIQEFNYHSLHNEQMNITMFNENRSISPEANVFVKNLPPDLNSKDLNEIFKMFGQIVSCKVASNADGELKGYGFVQYKSERTAKRVIEGCQNVRIGNYLLEVEPYDARGRQGKAEGEKTPSVAFTNCYLKNFPKSATEPMLREELERYVKINSLFLPLNEEGTPVGYACANFTNAADAATAIEKLHGKHIFSEESPAKEESSISHPFYIQRAEDKKDRLNSMQRRLEGLGLEGQRAKCNLYISNIPESFSKEEIKNIFSKFGQITDFAVSSSTGTSTPRQYGYICYSTSEEAALAYEKIDGTFLDGNKLQISFYRSKSDRHRDSAGRQSGIVAGSAAKPLVFLESLEGTGMDVSRRKFLQILYNSLLNKAESFSSRWDDMKVQGVAEFPQKIMLTMLDLPLSSLKEKLHKSDSFNEYIKKTIDNGMKRQCRVRNIAN